MVDGLDYAQMLEIPVSTVNVVKKKSFFKRRQEKSEDLKDKVVQSVNERVSFTGEGGDCAYTEDLSVPPKAKKKRRDFSGAVIMGEAVAMCLIAGGIFLCNVFMPDTAINSFMGGLAFKEEARESNYNEITLTSVVSDFSNAEVSVEDGVISFTEKTSVYPLCDGKVKSIVEEEGLYTVEIAHTSKFTSVFTGLDTVYSKVGDSLASNIPFAYSKGNNEVRVSMYDGETRLNCYTLSGAVPVWNS